MILHIKLEIELFNSLSIASLLSQCPGTVRSSTEAGRHTALTNLFTGRPARGIVNRVIKELGPIGSTVPAFPLAVGAIAPLRAKVEAQGSGEFSPLWSGQNASGCKEIPAADLTRELAGDL